MQDALIDFLNAVSRLPGCAPALRLRDALREAQYRRNAARAKFNAPKKLLLNTRKAGQALLAEVLPQAATNTPPPATALPPATPPADDDATRTLLRLRPAGRATPLQALGALPAALPPTAPSTAPITAPPQPLPALPACGCALNPLVAAGTALLLRAAALRQAAAPADLQALRAELDQHVSAFQAQAQHSGCAPEHTLAARYALCTLLDEAVLSTPWGADSPWAQHSLLSRFHNETWGGEKCFQVLERLLADPARHLPMLEFMALCLAMGLQGRYRVATAGSAQLAEVQQQLHQAIQRLRGPVPRELAPPWPRATAPAQRLARLLPWWAVASLAGVALLGTYLAFSWRLAVAAEPVYAQLARLDASTAPAQAAVAPVARTLSLREALAADIASGLVEVIEQARGSTIVLHGDGFFAPGSDSLDPALLPLLQRVGVALNHFDNPVQVSGHTDNQPLGSSQQLRFASNWALSQARAQAVAAVLSRFLDRPARLSAEGRGDAQPRQPNDTPAQRAQNRRVDITLLATPA